MGWWSPLSRHYLGIRDVLFYSQQILDKLIINLTDASTTTFAKKAPVRVTFSRSNSENRSEVVHANREASANFCKSCRNGALWLYNAEGSRQRGRFLRYQTSAHKRFRRASCFPDRLGTRLCKDPRARGGGRKPGWGRGGSVPGSAAHPPVPRPGPAPPGTQPTRGGAGPE